MAVDGRGDGHDDHGRPLQGRGIAGVLDGGALQPRVVDLVGVVVSAFELVDAGLGDVEADDVEVAGEGYGQREPHVAEPDDGQRLLAGRECVKVNHERNPLLKKLSVTLKRNVVGF